jgi:hypothetical protein
MEYRAVPRFSGWAVPAFIENIPPSGCLEKLTPFAEPPTAD